MERFDADICIAGAGFAGLTAALRLHQAGKSVAVLEARARIGGRTWTERRDDGSWIDRGGAWIGVGQDRLSALVEEMDVATYPTFHDGESIMVHDHGKVTRYAGEIPLRINPWTLANLGSAMHWLESHAKNIPLDAPWEATRAEEFDAQTVASWIDSLAIPSKEARDLLRAIMVELFTSDPAEVSMLHALYHIHSAGSLAQNLGVEDGAQRERVVGGMTTIIERLVQHLDTGAVRLEAPVTRVEQDAVGVTVISEALSVRAEHAVIAIPATLSNTIAFDPGLPADRALLNERLPVGSVIKIALVYDEPWWRNAGLTGESVALGSPVATTIDASTDSVPPAILNAFSAGPDARELARLDDDDRRQLVIDEMVKRFGSDAAQPSDYVEQDWAEEEYTRGCFMVHYPPGVLTSFGPALREPVGRIHWAGTETSPVMNGFIDGAVRSGERAAEEVLAAQG